MRLTAIKMAGFKSFVDPTTLIVPTNLTGVVGPNGCGKSNIIDAVRWVMGEGSARLLRGESMADVIFSGSASRKPVGTATVELLFDNSEGRVGGEFAGYAEISVKRQVSRDGISNYSLNNTRCRRKDITDLFLGTGLGARSYSIIEQGMITQIVDARPEEIRSHLEEAAGISLYKERRRETENRIRHTRDNLDRLSDLRDEVGKNLNKLKRQARAAERYKKFKEQARELESRLLALRWRALKNDEGSRSSGLQQEETRMQGLIAEQRGIEAKLEEIREQQAGAADHFSSVQGELYEVGGEIARLEQTISHERELQGRQQQEYDETSENLKDLEQHIVLDRAQVEESTTELAQLEPELEEAIAAESRADEAHQAAEQAAADWQARFDTHMQDSGAKTQQAEVDKTTIEHLEQRIASNSKRIEELVSEESDTDVTSLRSRKKAFQLHRRPGKKSRLARTGQGNQNRNRKPPAGTQCTAGYAEDPAGRGRR
jgi:chromosome segregation protein